MTETRTDQFRRIENLVRPEAVQQIHALSDDLHEDPFDDPPPWRDAAAEVANALRVLEHLTTDEFSKGRDRPARTSLARALAILRECPDEIAAEYLR